jgi:hypothetical protein
MLASRPQPRPKPIGSPGRTFFRFFVSPAERRPRRLSAQASIGFFRLAFRSKKSAWLITADTVAGW